MDLCLTLTLLPDEKAGPAYGVPGSIPPGHRIIELLGGDVPARVSVAPSSMGKGASGPAVDVVLHITEEVLNDGATLFAWGTVLRTIYGRIAHREDRQLSNQDPPTISALASSADPDNEDRLLGARLLQTICPTGGSADNGTDARDVWITIYMLANGDLYLIFSSPSGLVMGSVVVPPEWTENRGQLLWPDATALFKRLNGIS